MILSHDRRPIGQAVTIDAELANLSAWSEREWPLAWENAAGKGALIDALDDFLILSYDHAMHMKPLENVHDAVIARAVLIGIARAGTHNHKDLEAALGVPIPRE